MKTVITILFVSIFSLSFGQDGKLLIKANADCSLSIDGESQNKLKAEEVKKFPLGPGEHLVKAVYKEQKQEKIIKIASGQQSVLILKFDTTPDYSSSNAADLTAYTSDPETIFSFGGGQYGLRGRGVYSLQYPEDVKDEEGILEFKFKIEPDGSVSYATTTGPTTKTALRAAGIAAIKKWQFAPLDDVPPQWVKVKIIFRIKKQD